MRFKKIGAALLACAMCFGVFSTTAFAYVDESVATEEPAVRRKSYRTRADGADCYRLTSDRTDVLRTLR